MLSCTAFAKCYRYFRFSRIHLTFGAPFESARALVRFDHVASFITNLLITI
jgi:hypothetical protein